MPFLVFFCGRFLVNSVYESVVPLAAYFVEKLWLDRALIR